MILLIKMLLGIILFYNVAFICIPTLNYEPFAKIKFNEKTKIVKFECILLEE